MTLLGDGFIYSLKHVRTSSNPDSRSSTASVVDVGAKLSPNKSSRVGEDKRIRRGIISARSSS